MNIKDIPIEDIEAELSRRKLANMLQKAGLENPTPTILADPDLRALRAIVGQYIQGIDADGDPGKNMKHYIFECALETMLGPKCWAWINANVD